jgi:hypothetical protein
VDRAVGEEGKVDHAGVARRDLDLLTRIAGIHVDEHIRLVCEVIGLIDDWRPPRVNRVLNDEQRRGSLELRRGRTLIRDLDALARRRR